MTDPYVECERCCRVRPEELAYWVSELERWFCTQVCRDRWVDEVADGH